MSVPLFTTVNRSPIVIINTEKIDPGANVVLVIRIILLLIFKMTLGLPIFFPLLILLLRVYHWYNPVFEILIHSVISHVYIIKPLISKLDIHHTRTVNDLRP